MFEFSLFVAFSKIGKKIVKPIQIILLCLAAATIISAQAAGSLDTTFGNGGVVTKDFGDKSTEFIYATAIQADGNIIVGGEINDGYYGDGFLARYNTNGQLDPAFGINGFVRSPIGRVYSIIILSDGKIIVGNQSQITRLTAAGQVDFTFGNSGFAYSGFSGYIGLKSVSLQSDGKIITVGSKYLNGIEYPAIKRFTAAGQPDTSFGTNGEVISTATGAATTLAIQSDNRIVVSSYGTIVCPPQTQCQNVVSLIVRYTPTGQLDTSFGSGGTVNATDFVYSMAIQSDGRLLVGGNGISRYTAAGQLDATFGSGGTSFTTFPYSIAIQSDGKIVAGGYQRISRLTTGGQLDTSFGSGGNASTAGAIRSIAIQSNGSIVGGGNTLINNVEDTFLTRISTAGQLDFSFGTSGVISFNDRNGSETADSIAIQSDGKIVVGGRRFINGNTRGAITRFSAAGQLDNSFGAGGTFSTSNGVYDPFDSIAIQPSDGKIVAVGYSGITRLTAAGQLDASFGVSGIVSTNASYKLSIQPDGKILVENYVSSISSYVLARYTATGQVDTSFGTNGTIPLSNYANAIALQPDGKIIVNSYVPSSGSYILARYTTSGQLDTTFGSGGTVSADYPYAMAIQPDGKIVVVNYVSSTSSYVLARYTATGQPDASFGTNGIAPLSSYADAIAIQRDGKFILGGAKITRLTETGQIDFTFGTNGVVSTPINSRYNPVRAIVIQNDDKIVVGGINDPVFNKDADLALLRYNAGLVPDPCTAFPINYGQTLNGSLNSGSCVSGNGFNDTYTFSGNNGDQIAITVDAAFYPTVELLNSQGNVVQTVSGGDVSRSVRLPSSQTYFTLTASGTYRIRASGNFQGTGAYRLSLYKAPPSSSPCTYSLSSSRTNVSSAGGGFSFDVLTQNGCPPAAAPNLSGQIYSITSYMGGRVNFSVNRYTGTSDRQDTISIGGQTHTIFQSGSVPPTNDAFATPVQLSGVTSPPNVPVIDNTNATAETNETPHAGNRAAARSVWYRWTTPDGESGLYSFSTSGSSFNTVMDIYACPATGACSLANVITPPVGSNDDTTAFDKTSKVNFRAIAGTTYYIAVDGKIDDDGAVATGTIQLSWLRYERLYRLYLQNFNGNPSSVTPDSVTASNGTVTVNATRISQGVYEFNLKDDKTVYYVNISGPTGILWTVNNFPLGNSFSAANKPDDDSTLDLPVDDSTGNGQNVISNATNASPRFINGYIKNIRGSELSMLSVKVYFSHGPMPHDPMICTTNDAPVGTMPYVTYQCMSQPNSQHDIIPIMANRTFAAPVKSFPDPIIGEENGSPASALVALINSTFILGGKVLDGGAGTKVELTYKPTGFTQSQTLQAMTDGSGGYKFENLAPNVYTIKATRPGFVFNQPPNVNLQADVPDLNISSQTICTYEPLQPLVQISATGASSSFTVKTNNETCVWSATSLAPWITINSGASTGNGSVHFTVEANPASAVRPGVIKIGGQDFVIPQAGAKSRKRTRFF